MEAPPTLTPEALQELAAQYRKYAGVLIAHAFFGVLVLQVLPLVGIFAASYGRLWTFTTKASKTVNKIDKKNLPRWFKKHGFIFAFVVAPGTLITVILGVVTSKENPKYLSIGKHGIIGLFLLMACWIQVGIGYAAHLEESATAEENRDLPYCAQTRRPLNYVHIIFGLFFQIFVIICATWGYQTTAIPVSSGIWTFHWVLSLLPLLAFVVFTAVQGAMRIYYGESWTSAFFTPYDPSYRIENEIQGARTAWVGGSDYRSVDMNEDDFERTLVDGDTGDAMSMKSGEKAKAKFGGWEGYASREDYEYAMGIEKRYPEETDAEKERLFPINTCLSTDGSMEDQQFMTSPIEHSRQRVISGTGHAVTITDSLTSPTSVHPSLSIWSGKSERMSSMSSNGSIRYSSARSHQDSVKDTEEDNRESFFSAHTNDTLSLADEANILTATTTTMTNVSSPPARVNLFKLAPPPIVTSPPEPLPFDGEPLNVPPPRRQPEPIHVEIDSLDVGDDPFAAFGPYVPKGKKMMSPIVEVDEPVSPETAVSMAPPVPSKDEETKAIGSTAALANSRRISMRSQRMPRRESSSGSGDYSEISAKSLESDTDNKAV